MRFHGISMAGTFINEKVDSLPSWSASDEGRMLYDEATNLMYYGSNERWSAINEVIKDNLILYLSATGNDTTGDGSEESPWFSINAAFDWLSNKWINSTTTVTIQLGDGTYDYTEAQICNHPNGDRISIKGENYYERSISAVVNSTGTVGASASADTGNVVQAVLTLNSVANIADDDYVLVRNIFENNEVEGVSHYNARGIPNHIQGVFKVTNVNSGASQITITTTYRGGDATLGEIVPVIASGITGDLTVIKSILSFTECNGLYVYNGNKLGGADVNGLYNLVLYNTDYSSDESTLLLGHTFGLTGICIMNNSGVVSKNIGLCNWIEGLQILADSDGVCDYTYATGCYRGMYSVGTSHLSVPNATASGCGTGIGAFVHSSIYANYAIASCCDVGLISYDLCNNFSNSVAIVNCWKGAAGMGGHVQLNDYSRVWNCVYGMYGQDNTGLVIIDGTCTSCTYGMYCFRFGLGIIWGGTVFTDCDVDTSPAASSDGTTGNRGACIDE